MLALQANENRELGDLDAQTDIAASWAAARGEGRVDSEAASFAAFVAQDERVLLSVHAAGLGLVQDGVTSTVEAIVCAPGLPWPCAWALRTIYGGAPGCPNGESGGDPAALGSEWHQGDQWYFHGIWQIASRSPDPGLLEDPVFNTQRAAEKYRSDGASHWPRCGR